MVAVDIDPDPGADLRAGAWSGTRREFWPAEDPSNPDGLVADLVTTARRIQVTTQMTPAERGRATLEIDRYEDALTDAVRESAGTWLRWFVQLHDPSRHRPPRPFEDCLTDLASTLLNMRLRAEVEASLALGALRPGSPPAPILLVGPPGTGKTHHATQLAQALGQAYTVVSFGGQTDPVALRGTAPVYAKAGPGLFLQARAAVGPHGVIVIDEIDKAPPAGRGDVAAVAMAVLDPAQNHRFIDDFYEQPISLAHNHLIATANSVTTLPDPLLDRMTVIEFPALTRDDKHHLFHAALLPRLHPRIRVLDEVLPYLLDRDSSPGLRELNRMLTRLHGQAARLLLTTRAATIDVTLTHATAWLHDPEPPGSGSPPGTTPASKPSGETRQTSSRLDESHDRTVGGYL